MPGAKILVVEDNIELSEALKRVLEKNRFAVICAFDGFEALELYVMRKPDLIILDVILPKLNGFEVCRAIRRNWSDEHTPIVMMTGQCEDYDRIKGKVIGANVYLTKPIELRKLLSTIQQLCEPASPAASP